MRVLPALALLCVFLASLTVTSCRDEKKLLLAGEIDPERFPTMRTTDVSTLISDSGITRYRIKAPLWLVFGEAKQPQWRFPEGLHLEKFDDFFRRDATVDADSAVYFTNPQIWRLDGYVDIANMQGEKFLTTQLFWDQKQHKIYSDSFIHIEKSDRIIEGYGFESNERMTDYRVRNVSGIFPVEDFKKGAGQGGASATDSATQTTTVITAGNTRRPTRTAAAVDDTLSGALGAPQRRSRTSPRPSPGSATAPATAPAVAPATAPATAPTPAPAPASPMKRKPSLPTR